MGAPNVTDKVLDFLHHHQNINVTIQEMLEETGLKRNQIVSALGRLRGRYGVDVVPVVAGNIYRYRPDTTPHAEVPLAPQTTPPPPPTTHMFELVGTSKSGAVVIQDEDGKLYRAEEL